MGRSTRTSATIRGLWERVERWYLENAPADTLSLGPPASREEIGSTESVLAAHLPADVVDSYLVHNGSNETGVFEFGRYLLSLDEIINCWPLAENPEYSHFHSTPTGPIRNDIWNLGWIPLTDNGAGDHVCADLVPGEHGVIGQIIQYSHEVGPQRVLANSFADWLTRFTDELELGRFSYDEYSLQIIRIDESS